MKRELLFDMKYTARLFETCVLDRVARGVAVRFAAISAEDFVKRDWSGSCESPYSRRCESAGRDRLVIIVIQWRSKIQPLDASLYQTWKQQMGKRRKLPRSRFLDQARGE